MMFLMMGFTCTRNWNMFLLFHVEIPVYIFKEHFFANTERILNNNCNKTQRFQRTYNKIIVT